MEYEDSLRKVVKGAGVILIGTVIAKILTFVYNILIARIGAEIYGLFSISLAILNLIVTLAIIGLDTGIVRYISHYNGKNEASKVKGTINLALDIVIINSIIFLILLLVLADKISIYLFHDQNLAFFLKMIAFAIPTTLISVIFLRVLRSYLYTKYETYIKLIFESFSKVLFLVIFFALGLKIFGIVMAYNLALFGTLILSWYFYKKKISPILKNIKTVYPSKKELINYSLPLIFNEIAIPLVLWIDTFMISYFLDSASTGIYNVVVLIVLLMGLIPYSLMYLVLPILTEFYSQNKKNTFSLLYKTCTKWIFALNLVVFFLFLLISKEFLDLFFGIEYVKDALTIFNVSIPISVLILWILLIGFLAFYTLSCSKDILIIFKKTRYIALNTVIVAIFDIFLNLYLIPILGIVGAAIATSISLIIGAILIGVEAHIVSGMNIFKINYIKIFFSAVLSSLIIFLSKSLFNFEGIVSLIIYPIIFILLYLLFLIITKSLEREDMFVIKLLKRNFFRKVNELRNLP